MQQAASPQPKPANKELVKESDSSDSSQAGDTSPNGPVETPKDEAAKEVQLRPRPDYAETMEFVVKLRKDVQPCHSRYHPELRVTYKNSGGDAGVTSTLCRCWAWVGHEWWQWQDQERKVCRLLGATTPTPVRAAGVHQMTEEGHDKPQDPMWVTMLECERVGPFPLPTDFLVLQALFTVAMVSKIIRVKDLGQGNLGVRELRPGEPGALPEVVLLDCNSWEPYGAGQWPGFPNKARAGGFWNMVQHHDPHLKGGGEPLQFGGPHLCPPVYLAIRRLPDYPVCWHCGEAWPGANQARLVQSAWNQPNGCWSSLKLGPLIEHFQRTVHRLCRRPWCHQATSAFWVGSPASEPESTEYPG